MKVFLSPSIALHSPAMVRIQNALIKYLPPHYKVVNDREQADLCIFYPISYDWTHYLKECEERGQEYALVQCCFKSGREEEDRLAFDLWRPWWEKSVVVWSYLDLLAARHQWTIKDERTQAEYYRESAKHARHGELYMTCRACGRTTSYKDNNFDLEDCTINQDDSIPFYHAPLGIDEVFTLPCVTHPKRDYIVTTGTVHGRGAEAIEECWHAAIQFNLDIVHVGKWPENVSSYWMWKDSVSCVSGVTDQTLRGIYQNAKYVCSLRYVEGFELPALEALSCGTRSIVFTQPATTKWFFGCTDFVPECEGKELVDHLVRKFEAPYEAISQAVIDEVRSKFDWGVLAWRFWSIVEKEMSMKKVYKPAMKAKYVNPHPVGCLCTGCQSLNKAKDCIGEIS